MVDEGDRLVFESFLRRHGDEATARQAFLEWLERRDADATAANFGCSKPAGSESLSMAGEGVLATLRAGWDALSGVDVPKPVIGGLAPTAWKHVRYTRDADVLVAIDAGRVDEIVSALTAAGFQARHSPPLRVIDGQGIVQFTFQHDDALLP